MNYYDRMITAFTPENSPLLIVGAITFAIGYWQYVYSFRLIRREHMAPFPCWMHTFYFAHDSSWAVMFYLASARYHWNVLFMVISVAHMVWTAFESYNLVQVVRLEREEQFGLYFGAAVTARQAVLGIIAQLLAFFTLINLVIQFIGSGSYMMTALLTQFVMALGPGILWMRRRSRAGGGMGIALVVLLGTINTFMPWNMWVMSMPDIFDTAWFYLTGAVCIVISAAFTVMVARFPAKIRAAGQDPIW